ncbi:MAG: hypothetical protein ACI9R3_004327 [Verrucomicrobiales bacterium]|jgi:hypothetical protein
MSRFSSTQRQKVRLCLHGVLRLFLVASLGVAVSSCASLSARSGSLDPAASLAPVQSLPAQAQRLADLTSVSSIDRKMTATLVAFDQSVAMALVDQQRLGYFSNRQHAELERAYFRFRKHLRQLKAIGGRYAAWESPDRHAREAVTAGDIEAATIALYADRLAYHSVTSVVKSIQRAPSLITKFNEAFLISDEPRGTFDRRFHEITDSAGWRARTRQSRNLARVDSASLANPFEVAERRAEELHTACGKLRRAVIKRGYSVLPELSNELHHTLLASWVRNNRTGLTDRLRSARDVFFAEVAEIPYPGEDLAEFSPAQKRRLLRLLQPGDVLLTYTGGYMSNLFLPGAFKHAITYVGDNGQRRRAGLGPSKIDYIDGIEFTQLRERLEIESIDTPTGTVRADVIEAVAEGVIFNSLDHLLDTHVTRVVALRPQLTDDERRQFLLRVFSLLGTKYDFAFDFSDASSHCCTEVVYRALNQSGDVDFSLSRRGGYYNMSGDDIVKGYYAKPGAFELVFLAIPDPGEGENKKTRIFRGGEAEQQLRALVRSDG